MANIRPRHLVVSCYGYRLKNQPYTGVCIDLNIAVQADSQDELKKKMNDAIVSYFEAVLNTDDKQSIAPLIRRRAPLRDWVIYYLITFIAFVRQISTNFTFRESIPFHLAHNC
jgi:hypothetical protein